MFRINTGALLEASPSGLASLFKEVGGIECVVLNACFSLCRLNRFSRVLGSSLGWIRGLEIEQPFSSQGFYQALGAGRSIPTCSSSVSYRLNSLGFLSI